MGNHLGTYKTLCRQTGFLFSVPLAAWPGPELGSGQEILFEERDGDPVEADGLLIVHRSYQCLFAGRVFEMGAPSNHVVEIERGRARIPHEWAICSFHSGFPTTWPFIWPGPNLKLIPFIPGFSAESINWGYGDRRR